jgi:hypothetical protein
MKPARQVGSTTAVDLIPNQQAYDAEAEDLDIDELATEDATAIGAEVMNPLIADERLVAEARDPASGPKPLPPAPGQPLGRPLRRTAEQPLPGPLQIEQPQPGPPERPLVAELQAEELVPQPVMQPGQAAPNQPLPPEQLDQLDPHQFEPHQLEPQPVAEPAPARAKELPPVEHVGPISTPSGSFQIPPGEPLIVNEGQQAQQPDAGPEQPDQVDVEPLAVDPLAVDPARQHESANQEWESDVSPLEDVPEWRDPATDPFAFAPRNKEEREVLESAGDEDLKHLYKAALAELDEDGRPVDKKKKKKKKKRRWFG